MQSVNPIHVIKTELKIIRRTLNLLQPKINNLEDSISHGNRNNPETYFSRLNIGQGLVTPTQKASLDGSTNTNRIVNSINTYGKLQEKSNSNDKFFYYTGSMSLLKTPEYSALGSTLKSSPFLGKIVIDQQKQIQALKKQVNTLVDTMKQMTLRGESAPLIFNNSQSSQSPWYVGMYIPLFIFHANDKMELSIIMMSFKLRLPITLRSFIIKSFSITQCKR